MTDEKIDKTFDIINIIFIIVFTIFVSLIISLTASMPLGFRVIANILYLIGWGAFTCSVYRDHIEEKNNQNKHNHEITQRFDS